MSDAESEFIAILGGTNPLAEGLPKPRRKDGKPPCGECYIKAGEVCDICGAKGSE